MANPPVFRPPVGIVDKPIEASVIDNTGTYIYIGYAIFGTATSAASWQIYRKAISGTVTGPTLRADGNDNYDNIWDNRASLSYS